MNCELIRSQGVKANEVYRRITLLYGNNYDPEEVYRMGEENRREVNE
jgi:hypothetical protein